MSDREPIRKVSLNSSTEEELDLVVDKLKEMLNFREVSFSSLSSESVDIVMERINSEKLYIYIYTDRSQEMLFWAFEHLRENYNVTYDQEVDVLKYYLECDKEEHKSIFLRVLKNFICLGVENAKFELSDDSLILLNPNDIDMRKLNKIEFEFNDLIRGFEIRVEKS